jgi:sulfite exporter TauE/SafE
MCGGLVTATCERSQDVVKYQVGRLLGYLLLGLLAGILGSALQLTVLPSYLVHLPALFIGGLFIYWGVQGLQNKKAELPMPKALGRIYSKLWRLFVLKNTGLSRSFFTGLISILLPCGLLYGVILGTVALQHTSSALMAVFFFWLGTVPSMIVAPEIVRKVLRPLRSRLPKTYALSLMIIGVFTISYRMINFQNRPIAEGASVKHEAPVKHCH